MFFSFAFVDDISIEGGVVVGQEDTV